MSIETTDQISAVILAAGLSRRMGSPKMALAWGDTTVIGRVVQVLHQAGLRDLTVVTGGARQQVEAAVQGWKVRRVFNPQFAQSEMVTSLQTGLADLPDSAEAALVVLGDQPQIEVEIVRLVLGAYLRTNAPLVVPSYQMHRGHPWILKRELWPEVLALQPSQTLRDVLNRHAGQIHYVVVESDSILQDLDTPEDYQRHRPADALPPLSGKMIKKT